MTHFWNTIRDVCQLPAEPYLSLSVSASLALPPASPSVCRYSELYLSCSHFSDFSLTRILAPPSLAPVSLWLLYSLFPLSILSLFLSLLTSMIPILIPPSRHTYLFFSHSCLLFESHTYSSLPPASLSLTPDFSLNLTLTPPSLMPVSLYLTPLPLLFDSHTHTSLSLLYLFLAPSVCLCHSFACPSLSVSLSLALGSASSFWHESIKVINPLPSNIIMVSMVYMLFESRHNKVNHDQWLTEKHCVLHLFLKCMLDL